ncbi:NUDIX domain-containing protein [Candidatus Daviesbacteria bacterium]|nr:NUDIX domain-containing protein [Candidatus Daviesbacteria bacterium]
MQTSFYASGFLYSLKTHQILLLSFQQEDGTTSLWSTLGGDSDEKEDTQTTFQRIVNELFNLNLKSKNIYPVYDYFHDGRDKINYVFYAEVKNPQEFNPLKKGACSWVDFDKISKLLFTDHTKQDIIVGERVINAKWREDEAKKS